MLARIHQNTAVASAVLSQEYTNDARDLFIASSSPERSPYALPLSSTAATPDPLIFPPHWEGHPAVHPNTGTLICTTGCTSLMLIGRSVVLIVER
jgi:hypothetical protein